MTDLDTIRNQGEEEIAAILASLDERHKAILRDALRRYGSVENIPLDVWGKIQEDTEEELYAVVFYLMLSASGNTRAEIEGQGLQATRPGANRLAKMQLAAIRQVQQTAAASLRSIQSRLQDGVTLSRLDVSAGGIGELTIEGIDKALAEALGKDRTKTIATDATTEAIITGQSDAASGAGTTNSAGQKVTVEMRWQAEIGDLVKPPCKYCRPLHEQPEEVWSLVYPNGPGMAAHKNCRCWLRAVVVVEEAKPEDA